MPGGSGTQNRSSRLLAWDLLNNHDLVLMLMPSTRAHYAGVQQVKFCATQTLCNSRIKTDVSHRQDLEWLSA